MTVLIQLCSGKMQASYIHSYIFDNKNTSAVSTRFFFQINQFHSLITFIYIYIYIYSNFTDWKTEESGLPISVLIQNFMNENYCMKHSFISYLAKIHVVFVCVSVRQRVMYIRK